MHRSTTTPHHCGDRFRFAVLCLALAACSGRHQNGPPDASPDAGDAGAPDAEVPDADAPRPSNDPRVDSVATADGGHQIRQGETAELTIRGEHLSGATAVAAGALTATIIDVMDDRVRATLAVPHGFAKQALTLEVTTPRGVATLAGAIDTTPYVVTADAAPGGHGTYEAPLDLCDATIGTLARGDTLELAAGTYHCAAKLSLPAGVHIVGAGVGQTILDGFSGFELIDFGTGADTLVATLGGLTVRNPAGFGAVVRVDELGGGLQVDGFAVENGGKAGIVVSEARDLAPARAITIKNFQYRATGVASHFETAATVADSVIAGCAEGVSVAAGRVTIRNTKIQDCALGVHSGPATPQAGSGEPIVTVIDSQLTGDATGIKIDDGTLTIDHVDVTGAPGGAPCVTGVSVTGGGLVARAQTRIDCTQFGIRGATVRGAERIFSVSVDGAEITGSEVGIDLGFADGPAILSLRRARVHGGKAAVSIVNDRARCDLGTTKDPGQNELTAGAGGIAFKYVRPDTFGFEIHSAVGTTLNGHSYAGQTITGPAAEAADYVIPVDADLQF